MSQPIRLHTPTDVLDVLPALLGFYPTESLCFLCLDGPRLTVTGRIDLPTDPADTNDAALHLASLAGVHGDRMVLVVYTVDQEQGRQVLRTVLGGLDPARVLTAILASANGWTTLDPERPDVVGWTDTYPQPGTAAAQAGEAGLHATGTRDDLADTITAPDPDSEAAYHDARTVLRVPYRPSPEQVATLGDEVGEWIAAWVARPVTVTSTDAAWLTLRLQASPEVFDAALLAIPYPGAAPHAALWQQVAALTPDEDARPVLAVLAVAAWVAGNGTLSNLAIDRGSQVPGPRVTGSLMLELVRTILDRALPPVAWQQFRDDLRNP